MNLKKYQRGQMGSAIIGGVASLIGGERRNRAQIKMMREQMRFQERMSSTAFQRQTKDLEKAGLNRILGLSGSGASAPAGAMAAIQDIITPAVSTALAVKMQRQQIKNLQAEEQIKIAQKKIMSPATEAGDKLGEWIGQITNFDWSEAAKTLLKDLGVNKLPANARQLYEERYGKRKSPLQITIPGYKKDLKGKRIHRNPVNTTGKKR